MAPSALSVHKSPTKGRSLHATKSFIPGQIIATFDPLLLLPERAQVSTVCAFCLKPGKPRGCTRCKSSYYCNAQCQAAGWATLHSRECVPLSTQIPSAKKRRELPTTVRALMQVLLSDEVKAKVMDLEGHTAERRGRPGWKDLEMMAMAAAAFSGKGTGETVVREVVDLLCKIQTNAFHRYDIDFGQVGVFLEPTLAMVNHSCVPNAFVQFVGRKAVLRAETAIASGQEIEISYTDYTHPRPRRQLDLTTYNFSCACARCASDLTVYDVCASSPNIPLNQVSLVSDTTKLREAPDPATRRAANNASTSLTDAVEIQQVPESIAGRKEALGQQLKSCRELIDKDLWAMTPVPQILTELSILYAEDEKFMFSLAVACVTATKCDPIRYVAPFHPVRIKNVYFIVKLLTNTAALTATIQNSLTVAVQNGGLDQKIQDTLKEVDQVSLCQILLILVLKSCPGNEMADLEIFVHARQMLKDIEKLEGRGKEKGLIDAWRKDPDNQETRAFFDYAVVKQVDALAELGMAIIKAEFLS